MEVCQSASKKVDTTPLKALFAVEAVDPAATSGELEKKMRRGSAHHANAPNQTTQNSNNKSHAQVKPGTTSFLRYLLLKQQDLQEKQKTDERDPKRSLRLVISVNANERKRLCNAIKSCHTTISELIRQALVADGILPTLSQPRETE